MNFTKLEKNKCWGLIRDLLYCRNSFFFFFLCTFYFRLSHYILHT